MLWCVSSTALLSVLPSVLRCSAVDTVWSTQHISLRECGKWLHKDIPETRTPRNVWHFLQSLTGTEIGKEQNQILENRRKPQKSRKWWWVSVSQWSHRVIIYTRPQYKSNVSEKKKLSKQATDYWVKLITWYVMSLLLLFLNVTTHNYVAYFLEGWRHTYYVILKWRDSRALLVVTIKATPYNISTFK